MDCPRCGFSQPKDRFCAQCGVDVEQFLRRPTPLWRRIVSNPNTYVFLVGVLMALLVVLIVSSRVPQVWRAARGSFVTSREAGDPDEATAPVEAPLADEPAPAPPPAVEPAPAALPVAAPEAPATSEPHRLDAEFWEVSRVASAEVLGAAERIAEDQEGRALVIRDGARVREWLKTAARPLGPGFREGLSAGAQIAVETPPGAAEGLRFDLVAQVVKFENARAEVRFASSLSQTPPETTAEMNAAGPAFRAVIDTALHGRTELGAGETLVIVFHPINRRPRPEFITRAGPGPWGIFASPNFRTGETDWIVTIRPR